MRDLLPPKASVFNRLSVGRMTADTRRWALAQQLPSSFLEMRWDGTGAFSALSFLCPSSQPLAPYPSVPCRLTDGFAAALWRSRATRPPFSWTTMPVGESRARRLKASVNNSGGGIHNRCALAVAARPRWSSSSIDVISRYTLGVIPSPRVFAKLCPVDGRV
ncbi:hypothetical protein LX32DRAFT_86822 [Colletotrichum zoysiae]|uniref:Uncharacterized protein n=1 Tax=Colletotrichum zoysiae TaxID=1216348 RepID=A0AAD9HQE2_9PEZI|nr:hypothetical protein LX32DRAFT_86822 [Colletotrichum zoysiae]